MAHVAVAHIAVAHIVMALHHRPRFGSGCGAAELIGTPCDDGAAPTKRYNLMLVRSGPAVHAGRHGLAQRHWVFENDAAVEALYDAAGLRKLPVRKDGSWTSLPRISWNFFFGAYPLRASWLLLSAPPSLLKSAAVPANLKSAMKYMQASTGYFVPPVTGQYQFSCYSRSGGYGDAYVILSASADPSGGYTVAFGGHHHDMKLSRWITLGKGKMYYMEFWLDYVSDKVWHGGGRTSVAVRLALEDAEGRNVSIPPAVQALGALELGDPGCDLGP